MSAGSPDKTRTVVANGRKTLRGFAVIPGVRDDAILGRRCAGDDDGVPGCRVRRHSVVGVPAVVGTILHQEVETARIMLGAGGQEETPVLSELLATELIHDQDHGQRGRSAWFTGSGSTGARGCVGRRLHGARFGRERSEEANTEDCS